MTGATMARSDMGTGEAAERARTRRRWAVTGGLFLVGLPIGFFAGRLEEGDRSGFMTGTLPPWFAVLAAVVTVVAIVGGSVLFYRGVDELEKRDNRIATVMGANALMVTYPAWYLLWRGGLAGEPRHEALFILLFATTAVTYAVIKLRQRF